MSYFLYCGDDQVKPAELFLICQVCITMEILGKFDYGTPGVLWAI